MPLVQYSYLVMTYVYYYHPGKANKFVGDSSQKIVMHVIIVEEIHVKLKMDLSNLKMEVLVGKLATQQSSQLSWKQLGDYVS